MTALIGACSGGLAGAILNLLTAPYVQRKIQKNAAKAALRQSAIQDLKAWTSSAYDVGSRTSTLDPKYQDLLTTCDLSIKTSFKDSDYQRFRDFADWLDRVVAQRGNSPDGFPFNEFHTRREALVKYLLEGVWEKN